MKKIFIVVLMAAAFLATSCAAGNVYAEGGYKICFLDVGKVFDAYKKTQDNEKALAEKAKAAEKEEKDMLDELRKLKDEQALLSDKAKAEKQTEMDDKARKYQEFRQKKQEELIKERNDMLGGILKDIEKIIEEFAKEQGYDMVLNSRTMLYGKETLDVTNEIIKRVNK